MKKYVIMIGIFLSLGFTGADCATSDEDSQGGEEMMWGEKLFHVKGSHLCQSYENLGYSCDLEVRDALDCVSGHERLKLVNCCHVYNGVQQTDGRSIGYTPGACSPFL